MDSKVFKQLKHWLACAIHEIKHLACGLNVVSQARLLFLFILGQYFSCPNIKGKKRSGRETSLNANKVLGFALCFLSSTPCALFLI